MNFEDLISGSNNWKNMGGNNFDADIMNFMNYLGREGMSALGFDADISNYGGNSAFGFAMPSQDILQNKSALAGWLDAQVMAGTMTTYKMRSFYTPGGGAHGPVDVTYFAQAFNTGTFSSGDLVFTNATGDTATIRGVTRNLISGTVTMENFMFLTQTEPFTLGFIRMRAKSADQLENAMDIIDGTQYGGAKGNSITPDDYIDPDQYQFLRVDVPMNVPISNKNGFKWTIDEDQTGKGVSFTLFIPTTYDPQKALKGENPTRVLNAGVVPPFFTPSNASGTGRPMGNVSPKLIQMASNPLVKAVIGNKNIPNTTGIGIIRNIGG